MPKARKKCSKTKPVKVPQSPIPAGALTMEQKKERLAGYLNQFDKELEEQLGFIDRECKSICTAIRTLGRLRVMQLPADQKDIPLNEYLRMKGIEDTSANDSLMGEMAQFGVLRHPCVRKPVETPGWTATPKETPMLDQRLKFIAKH